MRIAVITDIHGNLPALEASLAAIDAMGVDALCCGGDLVGYGPHPNEVCALVEDRAIPAIHGNYDHAIGRGLDDCGCAYITPHDRELGQRSVEWTLAHTDERSRGFMRGLPFDLRFGHTHKPWIREHGGVLFVNCGSVGKPKDGDPRAAFAILETAGGRVEASIQRIPYDAESVAREVALVGLPSEFAEKLVAAA